MSDSLPFPRTPSDQQWLLHAEAVKAHFERVGRYPAYESEAVDGVRLGVWLNNMRSMARGTQRRQLADDRRAWLDSNLPGWDVRLRETSEAATPQHERSTRRYRRKEDDGRWLANAEAVKAHYLRMGMLPPKRAVSASGPKPGLWLSAMREAARGSGSSKLTVSRRAWLNANLPGWDVTRQGHRELAARLHRKDTRWLAHAQAAKTHFERTGSLPGRGTVSSEGLRLDIWLHATHAAASGTSGRRLSDDRREWLDLILPGWDDAIRDPDVAAIEEQLRLSDGEWLSRALAVKEHWDATGTFPAQRSVSADGVQLGVWLRNVRQAGLGKGNRRLSDVRRAWLDHNLPTWEGPTASA